MKKIICLISITAIIFLASIIYIHIHDNYQVKTYEGSTIQLRIVQLVDYTNNGYHLKKVTSNFYWNDYASDPDSIKILADKRKFEALKELFRQGRITLPNQRQIDSTICDINSYLETINTK